MKTNNSYKKAIILTSLAGIFLVCLFLVFADFKVKQIKNDHELETTNQYVNFQHNFNNYLVGKTSLLKGLKAYIEVYDKSNDELVYEYLNYLLEDSLVDIRNVGVIKDTTIAWNYPLEGNESSIGVDLASIEGQAEQILFVKNNLKAVFQGPVDLVQGGTGYIIREPIVSDGKYWGMISIVLKGEKFVERLDELSRESGLNVLIRDENKNYNIIYGDVKLLEESAITFESNDFYGSWEVSIINNKINNTWDYINLIIVSFSFLIISIIFLRGIYRYTSINEKINETNVILNEKVIRDALTGISTRNYFYDRVFEEVKRATMDSYDLVFIFCDIDHFKRVNDGFGHDTGDRILIEVADLLKSIIRESDVVTRWGGEEFLVMLPHTRLQDGVKVAEKMRAKLENTTHEKVGRVTASFGVASYISNEYIGSCINRADHAMYLAKTQGRNKVKSSISTDKSSDVNLKFLWNESLACGNQLIDGEHKAILLELADLVELSYFNEKKDILYERLNYLVFDLEQHFRDEESTLKSLNWENVDDHIKKHEKLLVEIGEMQNSLESMDIGLYKVLKVLNKAVVDHMTKEDAKFLEFLSK